MNAVEEPDGFAAFETWLGTPLPADPIEAMSILRREAAAEIERLIALLDALGGDPDLEPTGDEEEPTLGWSGNGSNAGCFLDGECEPSLGWTGIVNQASRNRLGDNTMITLDREKDDADDEDSDPGEESDEGELEPDAEPNGDEMDGNLAGTNTTEEEAAYSPSKQYIARLRERRGQPSGHRTEHGFHNLGSPIPVAVALPDESITIIHPDGRREDFDRLGFPVVR